MTRVLGETAKGMVALHLGFEELVADLDRRLETLGRLQNQCEAQCKETHELLEGSQQAVDQAKGLSDQVAALQRESRLGLEALHRCIEDREKRLEARIAQALGQLHGTMSRVQADQVANANSMRGHVSDKASMIVRTEGEHHAALNSRLSSIDGRTTALGTQIADGQAKLASQFAQAMDVRREVAQLLANRIVGGVGALALLGIGSLMLVLRRVSLAADTISSSGGLGQVAAVLLLMGSLSYIVAQHVQSWRTR